jgi:hypothetical protein
MFYRGQLSIRKQVNEEEAKAQRPTPINREQAPNAEIPDGTPSRLFSPAQCDETIRGVVPAKKRSHSHGGGALLAIAVFKFVKGAVLLALAFGALSFLHKDVASEVEHWIDQLRIDPDNQFIGALLSRLQGWYIRKS